LNGGSTQTAVATDQIPRNLSMQFSLRRMLLAVAMFAVTLGILTLYARRAGMFRSDSDPTFWWVAVTAMAFAVSGTLLVGHRRDLGRIVNTSVWTIAGFIAAAMLNDHQWLDHAIFVLVGRIPGLVGGCVLGGLIGGCVGCIFFRGLRPPPARSSR
jgi:hypothetical protein